MSDKTGKTPLMTIKNVSLIYDGSGGASETEALADVNLDIYKGDFITVLEPSGCGKSSLLNLMSGLIKLKIGEIKMNGQPVTGVNRERAVVFQIPTLYPWLSVRDNVAFGPDIRGEAKEVSGPKVDEYLKLVGLNDFADVKPYELSGGMRQRAALARSLVNEPSMILLDEPFGALDAFTRNSMQELIRNIWKDKGSTIFLITHDVDEALTLGSRIVTMSARPGRILKEVEADFTERIYGGDEDVRYEKEYVALRKELLALVGHGQS
jgi:taurine transport system ATP-binding protein